MRRSATLATGLAALLTTALAAGPAWADSGSGTSMTHIKTAPGLASTLEGAGVVLYTRGGATSAVMGTSIAAPDGQVVFHVPVTGTSPTVKHHGSTLVLFNTNGDRQVELLNPVIDLRTGVVRATVGTGGATARAFIVAAGGARDPATLPLGDLQGGAADAARHGFDQHPLAGAGIGDRVERVPRRKPTHGNRRALYEIECGGQRQRVQRVD